MKHPYPEHVVEAVARGIKPSAFRDRSNDWIRPSPYAIRTLQEKAREDAEAALQALWDASRVETIDDIHDVPESAVVRDKTGFVAVGREHAESNIDYDDYPAHIIHWGESDA